MLDSKNANTSWLYTRDSCQHVANVDHFCVQVSYNLAAEMGKGRARIIILDVTLDYLKASLPASFEAAGLGMATVEVDGKDFLKKKETDRSHSLLTKAGQEDLCFSTLRWHLAKLKRSL
jgi:hypothetical protein